MGYTKRWEINEKHSLDRTTREKYSVDSVVGLAYWTVF